jgi:hypothetical protein
MANDQPPFFYRGLASAAGLGGKPKKLERMGRAIVDRIAGMTPDQRAQFLGQAARPSATRAEEDLDAEDLTAEDLAAMDADGELAALFAERPTATPAKTPATPTPTQVPTPATPQTGWVDGRFVVRKSDARDPAFCFRHGADFAKAGFQNLDLID